MSVALAKVDSWEEHVEAWHRLGREADGAAWDRAAIAASVKGRWGEVSKFAEEVGFTTRSVRYYASTFEAFTESGNRFPRLTFTHHLRAVALTAGAEQATAALRRADSEAWSVGELTAYLRPPPELPEACATEGGTCGPVTLDDKIFHISALVENFYAVKDYEIEPLVGVGTKTSLRELSKKLREVMKWMGALNESIKRRTR